MKHLYLLFATILLLPHTLYAQSKPQFSMPLDCELGQNCWIGNYVDVDPASDSHKDFKCGNKTYEGHKGTDFALRNRLDMKKGINVYAASDGKVLRTRDGESDTIKTQHEYQTIKAANKDCGNGIILDHSNGLMTYYCHLKQGSIKVKTGEEVKEGDTIAQVGQSGLAEFPHLHFTVIWEGGHIDPFTGLLKDDGCGKHKNSLWKDEIPYQPYAHFDAGFSPKLPDFKSIHEQEKPTNIKADTSDAFVFWASFYQIEQGDKVTLKILDSNQNIFIKRKIIQEKNMGLQHYYTGRKLKNKVLQKGKYTGFVTIERTGHKPETHEYTINVQ